MPDTALTILSLNMSFNWSCYEWWARVTRAAAPWSTAGTTLNGCTVPRFFFFSSFQLPPHSFFWMLPLSSSLVRLSTPRRETVRHLDELRMRTETGRWWFDPILTESIAALKDLGRDLCRRLKSLSVVARVRTVIALTASSLLLLLMVFYPVSGFFFFFGGPTRHAISRNGRSATQTPLAAYSGFPPLLSLRETFSPRVLSRKLLFFFFVCVCPTPTPRKWRHLHYLWTTRCT